MEPEIIPRRQLVLLGVLFEGGLGGVAWLLGWALGQPCCETWHWDPRDAALGAAAALPMLLVFGVCLAWPIGPLRRIKKFSDEIIRPLFAPCSLLELALISVCAGIGEELLFRGVLQAAFSRWFLPWPGLAAASLLFGLLHPFTLTYILLATAMGAYLGLVWIAAGNLLVASVAHGLYDFLILAFLVRSPDPSRNMSPPDNPMSSTES
jgi:membrane protease YdiL (CAAX protease family)